MHRILVGLAPLLAVLFVTAFAVDLAAQPVIDIQKATNGQDADTAPGVAVLAGSTVNWTYVVSNTSGRPLTDIVVTDDQGVVVTCPDTTLDAGVSFTCTGSGVAILGQYANVGTVTADPGDGSTVSASDPSHYLGQAAAAVSIETSTNGIDADSAPGPVLPVGAAVSGAMSLRTSAPIPSRM
jgi:hypothetical protein